MRSTFGPPRSAERPGLGRHDSAVATKDGGSPRVHVVFAWTGSVLTPCYEPLVLRNDSNVPAQAIRIADISNGERTATFEVVPHLAPRAEARVWPHIEGASTRNGHPDFAAFIGAAHIGKFLDAGYADADLKAEFGKETALPLLVSYNDLDGNQWRSRGSICVGGKWGNAIVAQTDRFERIAP